MSVPSIRTNPVKGLARIFLRTQMSTKRGKPLRFQGLSTKPALGWRPRGTIPEPHHDTEKPMTNQPRTPIKPTSDDGGDEVPQREKTYAADRARAEAKTMARRAALIASLRATSSIDWAKEQGDEGYSR